MRPLPNKELHLQKGALITERDGAEVAMAYGDTFTEYQHATQSAALLDRSDRTLLRLEGEDRSTWLHGMTTSDVKGLPIGQGHPTTFCNAKGKVLGLGYVTKREADILIDLDPLCHDATLASLERLLITEDVTINDETGQQSWITLVGPNAEKVLSDVFVDQKLPKENLFYVNFEYAGKQVWLRKTSLGVLPAFDLLGGDELLELFAGRVPMMGWQAAEWIRIEGAQPRYGHDVTDSTIPQEAGLDGAISFEKGCYLGQETIARLHFRGHVNKHLRFFTLKDDRLPDIGAPISIAGEEKGKITSVCLSPKYKTPICLGYIRREFAEVGQVVQVKTSSGEVAGEVAALQ